MSDYDPKHLASKWSSPLLELQEQCQSNWETGRPTKRFFSIGFPEKDLAQDKVTPRSDRLILAYDGFVTLAHFARAFFPAYIPGENTHYGSVVYATDPVACQEVFELAWRVNDLRQDELPPPVGTESVATAIRDDQSNFSRIEMPPALGVGSGRFFANICIHRSRLPTGYIHSRLVPILIHPERTPWCSLLPLRFWSTRLVELWRSGGPAYPQEPFVEQCSYFNLSP